MQKVLWCLRMSIRLPPSRREFVVRGVTMLERGLVHEPIKMVKFRWDDPRRR